MNNFEFCDGITSLDLMESVLSDGYILTRNSLENKHFDYYKNLYIYSLNGDSRVSISCHVSREYDYIRNSNRFIMGNCDRAFGNYIECSNSIILRDNILDNFSYKENGIIGEYQIEGDISLDYMVGIGIRDYFKNLCDNIENILSEENSLKYKYNEAVREFRLVRDIDNFLNCGYSNNGYDNYYKVEKLLEKYGYSVPIVDPCTGMFISSKEENYRRLEELRDKALEKKLIRF